MKIMMNIYFTEKPTRCGLMLVLISFLFSNVVLAQPEHIGAHVITWRWNKAEFGIKIWSQGKFTYKYDRTDPVVVDDMLHTLKNCGVDFIINDLTNWEGNGNWAACDDELPVVTAALPKYDMKQVFLFRAQSSDITVNGVDIKRANEHAKDTWEHYAQLPTYFHYKGKPLALIYKPSAELFWAAYNQAPESDKTYLKKFQLELVQAGGWGWADGDESPDGYARSVKPYTQKTPGAWVPNREKISPSDWEKRIQWGMQTPSILILSAYDEFSDGSHWAPSDNSLVLEDKYASEGNKILAENKVRLCNQYEFEDKEWGYFNAVLAYCNKNLSGKEYQAEATLNHSGIKVQNSNNGYTGDGYLSMPNNDSWFEISNVSKFDSISELAIRYANGGDNNLLCTIFVNGNSLGEIHFEPTGDWKVWKTIFINTDAFTDENNTVKILATTSAGAPNIDKLIETSANNHEAGSVQATVNIPGRIEAENYAEMLGVDTQKTSDVDGDENVGWTHVEDWMEYDVNVEKDGIYEVRFRLASQTQSILFDVLVDNEVVCSINSPTTGGHQIWKTVSETIKLTSGQHTLKINVKGGGWNINWMDFVWESEISGNIVKVVKNRKCTVFPNPVSSKVNIQFPNLEVKMFEVSIYNMNGTKMKTQLVSGSKASIDVRDLKAGVYLLKTTDEELVNINRFIKK